ncbi:uncharacterized protein LOC117331547 [Pecten maximus]|uniref:uncharacterized protein LOC117331547 n=1 Tax=Pecten maximus TaxID=6579 RepID=UPI0014588398|nr:uncharacterized protein LOC117331547 [Pecten maximus]
MLHFRPVLIAYLLGDWTSGSLIDVSASDRCGQYLHFDDDSKYFIIWNSEKDECEVRFANSNEDSSICVRAQEFSVDCNFELRLTEGLGVIPVKTFTCLYNTSSIQYCSQKGRSLNVQFFTVTSSSSEVSVIVNQTKPAERHNPFLLPVVSKIAISCFIFALLTVSSVFVYVRRAVIFRNKGCGCTAQTATPTPKAPLNGGSSETSGMLCSV